MNQPSKKPPHILVFSPLKKLVAIFNSTYATAKSFHARIQSIQYACDGTCMSCQGHYFRYLLDDIEVTNDDLGVLSIEEYDQLCGVERKIYRTGRMERKGMKYNKQPKE